MPNDDHEEAVRIARDYIAAEFDLPVDMVRTDQGRLFKHFSPDLYLKHPEDGRWIMVEVGTTNAEKIGEYLK